MSSPISFSSSSDEEIDQILNLLPQIIRRKLQRGGRSGRNATAPRQYRDRQREVGHARLWNDYFAESPVYDDRMFRRRFRMRKQVFLRILGALENDRYFQQHPDACGRLGLSGLQKCTSALRMLAYGCAADAVDDYVRIGESTARQCLLKFTQGIISAFGDQYLRKPTPEDLSRLLQIGEQRGFPGMLGSIDCMHWEWKNCPAAWRGMFQGRSGKATLILEAVASQDLWIWHAFFGIPGSSNDLNVLYRSPVFDDVLHGRAPPVSFNVNGHQYHMGYYLTDGIYPQWASFIRSITLPQTPKDRLFAQRQEAVRKDVERAFGVLQARFKIIRYPSLAWDQNILANIMKACIILHNMIVEDERDTYERYFDCTEFGDEEASSSDTEPFQYSSERIVDVSQYLDNRDRLRSRTTHVALKNDLIENIWRRFGEEEIED